MKRALLPMLLLGMAFATPATDLLDDGDYARAYDAAMNSSDKLTAAQAALAQVMYRTPGDRAWTEKAIQASRAAVKANPNNPVAYRVLSGAVGAKADYSGLSITAFQLSREARAALEKSIALNPNYADGRISLARWHAGAYAKAGRISGGNPDTARKLAIQALNDAPQSIYVHAQAGIVFSDLKDPRNAKTVLERAVSLNATNGLDKDAQTQARALLNKLK